METNWEREYLTLGNLMTRENLWNILKCKLQDLINQFVHRRTTEGRTLVEENGKFSHTLQEVIRGKHVSQRRWMSETARLIYAEAEDAQGQKKIRERHCQLLKNQPKSILVSHSEKIKN